MAVKFKNQMVALEEESKKKAAGSLSTGVKPNLPTLPAQKQQAIQNVVTATNNTGGANASPAATEKAAYYSRPQLGTFTEKLYNKAKEAESGMQDKYDRYTSALSEMEEAQASMENWSKHVQMLRENYKKTGSAKMGESLKKAQGFMLEYIATYTEKKNAYESAYADFEPANRRYGQAVTAYNNYIQNQQEQLDAWKGTIRDTDTIQGDMNAIDGEIKLLEYKIQRLNTLTRFRNDALGQYMKQSMTQSQVQLEELQKNRALLQEEYDWSQYFLYSDLKNADDFQAKSQYATTANGQAPVLNALRGTYTETGFDDLTYDFINRNQDARNKAKVNSIGDNTAMLGLDTSYLEKMTDDEITTFNYLYATQGADAAYAYTAYLTNDLTARQRMDQEAYWSAWAKEQPGKASVFSVLTSPLKSVGFLGQTTDYISDGIIDQNASYNKFSHTGNAIVSEVAKEIEESGNWGKAGSYTYQLGMSLLNSLMTRMVTFNNPFLVRAIMGTSAAADATIVAKDRGLSDDQAYILGTVAGIAEAAIESINVEEVFKPDMILDGVRKYLLKTAGAEGFEEGLTDIVNIFADILVSKDQSEWQQSIDAYVKNGKTHNQATWRALLDQALTIGLDIFGGAVSGGIMSGANAFQYNRYTNQQAKALGNLNLDQQDIQSFIETGLESGKETTAYKLATEMKAKLDAGEQLSNQDIARMYQANTQAVEEESAADNNDGTTEEETGKPGRLRPRAVDDVAQNAPTVTAEAQNVIESSQNITQNRQNVTATQIATLSVAAQIRQNQTINGGIQNGTQQQYAGPAASQFAGTAADAGAGLLPGNGQRYDGAGAGEQAGSLAGRAGSATKNQAVINHRRTTVDRQNRIRSLRLPKISSKKLGLPSGTETQNVQVVPQEHYDTEMEQLSQRVYQKTGKAVTFVMGRIQIRTPDGNVRNVNGVVYGDRIIVRADHLRLSMEQIADHEAYHGRVDYFGDSLNQEIRRHIVETYSEEEFRAVLGKYVEAMRGVYDVGDIQSGEDYERMLQQIQEEVFADAYAGINAFGAGADRFTSAVNEKMEQLGTRRLRNQDNGVRETNGPPSGERYSYDGENREIGDSQTFGIIQDNSLRMIYPGMDDSERAEVLTHKKIRVPVYDDSNPVTGAQIIKLKGQYVTKARSILTELARKCGAFSSDYHNAEINLDFAYSNKSLKESVSKQSKRGGGAEEFGKMLTVLPEICENAVEIEAHTDRYIDTARADEHLKEMHILLGAFYDGVEVVPVQLEIKEFLPESNQGNKLYVTVTIKEAGVTPRGSAADMADVSFRSRPASIISLTELIRDVKDNTGDLVKYFPDSMLTAEQKLIKEQALERDKIRLNDMRYEYAVENQNSEKALGMLRERATEKGYSEGSEYRMAHRAPDSRSGVSLVDADRVYGGDGSIYSAAAAMYYGEGRSYDGKAIRAFTHAHFNPNSSITVYRAVPKSAQDTKLRNGDWVSPTREYAMEHGERTFDDGYRIVSEKVPAKHLYVNGDSIHEFGYDNGQSTEVYKNTRNNVKLDEITYDDSGNLISLSKRYDESIADIRYSVDDDAAGSEYQYNKWEQKQSNIEKAREKRKADAAARKTARDNTPKPETERPATMAKKNLRGTVFDLFSVPGGVRGELASMIDNYAERLLKNGVLTEADRKHFFDRMYESGVMTVQRDDYFSEGRNLLSGGRVYVPDNVRRDFGDDWGDIRRRAFGSGIYFTSDRSAGGIDSWNHELAEMLPGLFDSEETDMRFILERIVEVAEEGRDEKMSLPEYTARLAEQEHTSESELLYAMEQKLDEALRTFAENAKLEVQLKKQSDWKIAKERAVHREMAQRQKDRKELRELQQKTLKTLQWLNKNRNRAPEELKGAFDEVLGDIDLYAVGAANEMQWSDRYNATWKDLAQMYKDASKSDPNFLPSKELERIVGRLDGTKIAEMDLGALNDLYKVAVGLRTEFYNRNNVIDDEMDRLFEEVYTDAKKEINAAPGGYTGKKLDKFVNMDQLTPMNVLQRMGGWDPNGTFYSMAKQLEKGERDMRAYSVKAQKMLQEFLTEHEDWVKKADGQGKDGIWYEVEIPELIALELGKKPKFGATIKVSMTPAQKVHMYLESKNVDNLRHMTGGRTFADKKLYSEGKRQEALAQGRTIRMAPETVKAIVADLTAEEMELARVLEQYYNSFATQEINRVSNILYGYDKAMGKNYAPIYTNRNYTKTEFGVFDQTAEGVGNLKGRQYSVNPSYNISAFDAFERHVDQTARFVGMAIPARNWTTLMNWREQKNSTGDVITHKWGEEGKRYITELINTLQAGDDAKNDSVSALASKLQSTYITAIFGANPSIVLKQLGSIPLASAYLDARNIPTPQQIKSIDRELIGKYTQDLEWRTMGYSMPETRQLKENPNWTQTNKFYNFTFGGGAITAMDGWAASVLWPWAENKVSREFPNLEVGTQEQIDKGESPYYKKVAEVFEDALSRSQSTSDEIHQSSLRKSKNLITKAFTMFRSDSAQTYNALRQKIGEAQYYIRTGADEQIKKAAKKTVGAAVVSLLMNSMWSEAINFLMALWKNKGKYYRNEDDELTVQSVAGEMVSGMVGSFGGIVTGGEELLEVIGNLMTGEKIYDIETPGIEQLNDFISAVTDAGGNFRDVIAGAVNVAANGGDLGDYFGKHSNDLLGSIKELAETAVMYLPGLAVSGFPASNLEAYLLGAVKWLSPKLATAYEDLFQRVNKNDLKGLTGNVLTSRVGRILNRRKLSESDETAGAIAELYEAGFIKAMPGDTPASISIDGEDRKLSVYQQQQYEKTYGSIVFSAIDEIIGSDSFINADAELKTKILSGLYDYAAECAKSKLFPEFVKSSRTVMLEESANEKEPLAVAVQWVIQNTYYDKSRLRDMVDDELEKGISDVFEYRGMNLQENTLNALIDLYENGYTEAIPSAIPTTVSINGEEKTLDTTMQRKYCDEWVSIVSESIDEMVSSNDFANLPYKTQSKMLSYLYSYAAEITKGELFDQYVPNTREDSVAAFAEAGMSMTDFLYNYGKYSEIFNSDGNATEKATELAYWLDSQNYTSSQKKVIRSELAYYNMSPASAKKYDDMVAAGMSSEEAFAMTGALSDLEPREGEDKVTDVQSWRECIKFSDNVAIQLAALRGVADDNQYAKIQMAYDFGVKPDSYVGLQEIKSKHDADGNGSFTNDEMKAAVDSLPGLTTEQRAVLWQLGTGNKSAKNNPYSREMGQKIVDARAAAKEGSK